MTEQLLLRRSDASAPRGSTARGDARRGVLSLAARRRALFSATPSARSPLCTVPRREEALDVDQWPGCTDILMLMASMRGAINGLIAELMEEHIRHHAVNPDNEPDADRAEAPPS